MKTCFFIGHRDAPEHIQEQLIQEVERSITEYSITNFVVGGYGSFDAMAAGAVKQARKQHPEITLQLLLPYHPAFRSVSVPEGFDGTLYPVEKTVPPPFAIVEANRVMVGICDYLIAYAVRPGNAQNLLEYAQMLSKRYPIQIRNLGDL